ncbi:hypothetical protein M3M33_17005, partial [Loigolactobacillus coryniformis]|uniref:hypothetical protein n=1 Tax=Loigolactobacillus coryniformis TaxID=1610 RepID=UPI00201A6CE1
RQVAEQSIDPIKSDSIVESGMYGAFQSVPYMAAAAIPYAGIPIVAASMAGQEYDRLRMKYPDMSIESASRMSVVSGIV